MLRAFPRTLRDAGHRRPAFDPRLFRTNVTVASSDSVREKDTRLRASAGRAQRFDTVSLSTTGAGGGGVTGVVVGGGVGAGTATATAPLVAAAVPSSLVAVTAQASWWPTSAAATV